MIVGYYLKQYRILKNNMEKGEKKYTFLYITQEFSE